MSKVKLKLQNIHKRFDKVMAVDGFTQDIMDGECVVLLGPSGCGKTTLLRLIAGFLRPDEGTILMDDREISSSLNCVPPDKRKMSMVFQSYALWPNRTVFENVAYGLKLKGFSSDRIQAMVRNILKLVGMSDLENRYPAALSGGQQQRVSLARALVVQPGVVLLDEPLSNLDAKLRIRMRDEIREIQRQFGLTFVYVTHDQAEAMVLGDRIMLMNKGQVEQVGTAQDLYLNPQSNFVANFIGTSNQIHGSITEVNKQKKLMVVNTEFDEKIHVALRNDAAAEMKQDEKVIICVRPEKVHLSLQDHRGQANVFRSQIKRRRYYGNIVEYVVETTHHSFSVQAEPDEEFPVGKEIFVHIEPQDCIVVKG